MYAPANERWRYNVPPSLIGWVHAQNAPCLRCARGIPLTANYITTTGSLSWRYNVTGYNVMPPLIGWAHTQNDPCLRAARGIPSTANYITTTGSVSWNGYSSCLQIELWPGLCQANKVWSGIPKILM